jgi:hypothetical protein
MTTTAVADEQFAVGLTDQKNNQVHDAGPEGDAPQKHREAEVETARAVGSGGAHRAFLCVMAFAQIAWLMALGYGAVRLLT